MRRYDGCFSASTAWGSMTGVCGRCERRRNDCIPRGAICGDPRPPAALDHPGAELLDRREVVVAHLPSVPSAGAPATPRWWRGEPASLPLPGDKEADTPAVVVVPLASPGGAR